MSTARMNGDETLIFRFIADGSITDAQKALKSYLERGKYRDNPNAALLRERLSEHLSFTVPYNLSGIVDLTFPDMINDKLAVLRPSEEALIDDIMRIDRNISAVKDMGVRYVNSTLLYGPPGTGKTLFAAMLSKRMNIPMLSINTSTVISAKLGETSRNLSEIFSYASANRAVFFIDEIDMFGSKRGAFGDLKEMNRVTVSLMTLIDKMPSGSVVIGATNIPETLDSALLRRFERKAEIRPLSNNEAVIFVKGYLGALGMDYEDEEIRTALPDKSEFIQAKIISLLNHEIVRGYPGKTDLRTTLAGLTKKESI